MNKYFNIAGPCNATKHYIISPIERNREIMPLIEQEQYFVIHAARQSGKTNLIRTLTEEINKKGEFYALYISLEALQGIADIRDGMVQLIAQFKKALHFKEVEAKKVFDDFPGEYEYSSVLNLAVAGFAHELGKPLVLFFDEVDCLQNGLLISFLRQLRDGFVSRSDTPFAHSIALVGMRDIRDYKAKIRDNTDTLGSASPFNIVTESLTIGNFTQKEVQMLIQQHVDETGQDIDKEAVEQVYYWTEGQPWLTNAVMREVIVKILKNDFTIPVTAAHIDEAAQNIMMRRDTHLDSLLERLKEERVRKVVEPVIRGNEMEISMMSDDVQYCLDLGIIKDEDKRLKPSNPIYAEVIIRTLTYDNQYALYSSVESKWADGDKLDMHGLMKAFQQFWRENSDVWIEKYQYREAAPHLIMQAFLQRVINGGGLIDREYATGRRRMDLCVHYHGNRYAIELKLRYNEKTMSEGIQQLSAYLNILGLTEGWLVLFDRRPEISWEEKIFWYTEQTDGKTIYVVGC